MYLTSEVYPAGNLHGHFTYGFDFRHSLRLPFVVVLSVRFISLEGVNYPCFAVLMGTMVVLVEAMGHFSPWDNYSSFMTILDDV